MFVSVPPKLAHSDLVRKMKGRSSHKMQREFPAIQKRYRGCRCWGRGIFQPPTAPSRKTLYISFLITPSLILPASAGSHSVQVSENGPKPTFERTKTLRGGDAISSPSTRGAERLLSEGRVEELRSVAGFSLTHNQACRMSCNYFDVLTKSIVRIVLRR